MHEKSSPPLGIEPWVEGPEIDEYTVTVNVMMWLLLPLVFALLMWCALWLMYFPANLVNSPYLKWVARIGGGYTSLILFLVFLTAPYIILHEFQLNRLSARLRGFLLGAFPSRAPLLLFHTLFCAVLLAAITLLGLYVFDYGEAFAALASGWRRPGELLGTLAHALYAMSWLGLFALTYFYLLLFWLAEEIFFALRFEVSTARVEKVESFKAPLSAAPFASVAHLTDLHVTATDDTARVDGGPGGNRPLAKVIS